MKKDIRTLLCSLGICDNDSIVEIHHKVRDSDNISVSKCQQSGVIFLSNSEQVDLSYYKKKREAWLFGC